MLDVFKAIILGVIEGITEWLPISSTGHIILAERFFLSMDVSESFRSLFEVVIQLGAIMAVVVLFWNKLWPFTTRQKGIIPITKKVGLKRKSFSLWMKVVVATIPCVILGLPFDKFIFEPLEQDTELLLHIIAITLIVYGIAFLFVENLNKKREPKIRTISTLDYKTAFFIGLFQALAMVPGTSRSGATILGAIILGCSRTVAAEFSFYLAIPTMFGASALKLFKHGFNMTGLEFAILSAGMIMSFIVSIIAIKFLLEFVPKTSFKVSGYYRIALGAIVLLYFALI